MDRAAKAPTHRAAILAGAILAAAMTPALATSNYEYKTGEYVVIADGLAPDKRLSIAAHGGGDLGYDGFRLYLMAEPAHTAIAPLDSITGDMILDTGAGAYHAAWSSDSRHVAVHLRTDRHVLTVFLYEVHRHRAHLLDAPSLFAAVTTDMPESTDAYVSLTSRSVLTWTDNVNFVLRERRLFRVSTPALARKLGRFGRRTADDSKPTEGEGKTSSKYFLAFSAVAVCRLKPGRGCRMLHLKAGPFD